MNKFKHVLKTYNCVGDVLFKKVFPTNYQAKKYVFENGINYDEPEWNITKEKANG